MSFISEHFKNKLGTVHIEGLSFGSLSGEKDILAGNYWFIRCAIKRHFPDVEIRVFPVTSWRSPLFNKEERKQMKEFDTQLKELKKEIKSKPLKEKKDILVENEKLIKGSSIKYQTFLKLPIDVQNKIMAMGVKEGRYDLTDAYFIAHHIPK